MRERWAHAPVKHLADVAPGLERQQGLDHVQVRQVQLVVERLLQVLVGNKNTLCWFLYDRCGVGWVGLERVQGKGGNLALSQGKEMRRKKLTLEKVGVDGQAVLLGCRARKKGK